MIKLSVEKLRDMDLPYSAIHDKIVGTSRWSIQHEIVFEYEGKHYETSYQVGATESQDEGPWEYEKEVDCYEVELVEKVVKIWQRV
jgi:hypothetical protein